MSTAGPFFQLDIPKDQRPALLRRLAVVWTMSLFISVGSYMQMPAGTSYAIALVYSYAISTFIWFFTDVLRFLLRVPLKAEAPIYWPPPLRAGAMLLLGIPLGYLLGTLVGDAFAGHSTWDLWQVNRSRFTGMLVSSIAISVAFTAYFYQRSRAEHQEHKATEAQLMLLQAQLEPHMLFNTLANLRALISVDPQAAQTMLDHLDGYLRATLGASRAAAAGHRLEDEFARLTDYLALMAVRMGPRLQVTLDLPAALRSRMVPPLILQPLVENSIRHGLEPQLEGGEICVRAERTESALVLQVIDTGRGYAPPEGHTEGFGLTQIRQRLEALYGSKAHLHIAANLPVGTVATITLPL